MKWHISLPWPPYLDKYGEYRYGRSHIKKEKQTYQKRVASIIQSERRLGITMEELAIVWPLRSKLRVIVHTHPSEARERNIADILQMVLEGLGGADIYKDSSQIDDLRILRGSITRNAHIVLTIEELA